MALYRKLTGQKGLPLIRDLLSKWRHKFKVAKIPEWDLSARQILLTVLKVSNLNHVNKHIGRVALPEERTRYEKLCHLRLNR